LATKYDKNNETNLVKFFGGTPFIRIVDALIDNIGEDYSKKELQELAGISKASFFTHWHKVEELGLVKVTRSFGKAKLHTLNEKSPLVKDMMKFEVRMISKTAPKTKERERQLAVAQ